MDKLVVKAIQVASKEAKKRGLFFRTASVHECHGCAQKIKNALVYLEFANEEGVYFNVYVDTYNNIDNKACAVLRDWKNDKGDLIDERYIVKYSGTRGRYDILDTKTNELAGYGSKQQANISCNYLNRTAYLDE